MKFESFVTKITNFVETSPLNKVDEIGLKKIYDQPLVGIADANDAMFVQLKSLDVIGPNHYLPTEWLTGAKTVISYFLPLSEEVRGANSKNGLPAIEWVHGQTQGETLNDELRAFIVDLLRKNGASAVAPGLDPRFSLVDLQSNWSERHVAYIAGLGTFGLSRSLITKKGCAGRYGSVVTEEKMEPTPRAYTVLCDYCTTCGECIARCPSGAIAWEGKDIPTCATYFGEVLSPVFDPRFGCGKCQTAVPCEFMMP